jgi:hypothetical protein
MDKEFVPYEQALALKELGFDDETLKSYDTSVVVLNGKYLLDDWYDVNRVNTVKAPLYQQAFRWFREKYNLHSYVEGSYPWFRFYINSEDNRYEGHKHSLYEEAELECLKKLIEIVKENNNG